MDNQFTILDKPTMTNVDKSNDDLNENMRSLKDSISKGIPSFISIDLDSWLGTKNSECSYNIRLNRYDQTILIKYKLKKKTNLNKYLDDIYFHIVIDRNFPESCPLVTCNSNVSNDN